MGQGPQGLCSGTYTRVWSGDACIFMLSRVVKRALPPTTEVGRYNGPRLPEPLFAFPTDARVLSVEILVNCTQVDSQWPVKWELPDGGIACLTRTGLWISTLSLPTCRCPDAWIAPQVHGRV